MFIGCFRGAADVRMFRLAAHRRQRRHDNCALGTHITNSAFQDGSNPVLLDNIRASYRAGGDSAGNVPVGAIQSVLSGVLARGVRNPLPAEGGEISIPETLTGGPAAIGSVCPVAAALEVAPHGVLKPQVIFGSA